jgi:Protein of unknown function (DUF551).
MDRREKIRTAAEESTRGVGGNWEHIRKGAELWFIRGAIWSDSHPQWIPVEEELPPENGKTQQSISVWATDGLTSGEFRYNFDTKTWTNMWGDPFDITHWMPLPMLPQEKEE